MMINTELALHIEQGILFALSTRGALELKKPFLRMAIGPNGREIRLLRKIKTLIERLWGESL